MTTPRASILRYLSEIVAGETDHSALLDGEIGDRIASLDRDAGLDVLLTLYDAAENLSEDLAAIAMTIAGIMRDSGWRPKIIGDDVVVVTGPTPSSKVHDEETFWTALRRVLELDAETVEKVGRLFNPNYVRRGAMKALAQGKGFSKQEAGLLVESLFDDPGGPDLTRPKVARIPVTKYPGVERLMAAEKPRREESDETS